MAAYDDLVFLALCHAQRGRADHLMGLPDLTPARAAEVLRRLFTFYLDRALIADEFPDGYLVGWHRCCLHLVRLGGEAAHAVSALTGASAPLGLALRVVDLQEHSGTYFDALIGVRRVVSFMVVLATLLRRMCAMDEPRYERYLATARFVRRPPRALRTAPVPLYVLFSRPRLELLARTRPTDDRYVEADLLALRLTPEDVREAVCPHTGNTLLHWAALSFGGPGWATQRALALACAVHVLLVLGADPNALNLQAQTPRALGELAWRETLPRATCASPLVETLRLAEADRCERRLAIAMGTHARLGAASPLGLIVEGGLLAQLEVGASERLPRAASLTYAARLRCVLRGEGLVAPIGSDGALNAVMDEAVLRRSAPTPRLLRRFRIAAQIDASEPLQRAHVRLYRYLRRLSILRRRRQADGSPYAVFHALRIVGQRVPRSAI